MMVGMPSVRHSSLPAAPAPLSWQPARAFQFVGGDPCLDFINTVDWTEGGLLADRLTSYERVVEWAEGAGVLTAHEASRFRRGAATRDREAARAVAHARQVREVLAGVVYALGGFPAASHLPPAAEAIATFNALVAQSHAAAHLEPESDRPAASPRRTARHGREHVGTAILVVRWPWQRDVRTTSTSTSASAAASASASASTSKPLALDSLLWPVVRHAAALLTSTDAAAIRMCAGTDCGWVFVDRSRGRRRRWCAMETCGTLAKEARRSPRARSGG